ncbi:MAG: cellulase family glycosylhydrolase [Clostridia bacterium]|nr:cellulase family glycosylhydrolase [Clostridia bacterium]
MSYVREKLNRNRVNGLLRVDGRRMVNGVGEEVLLAGWGLGNWLLCEGYMWLAHDLPGFDRPRRIEAVIAELAGEDYAASFWPRFRANYIAEKDFEMMAQMGYNSVRIPINARLFVEEAPGVRFRREGFECLDRALDWCEKHRLYAFIDLHGAPGGQTGANIDDSVDDVCHLLTDDEQFEKGVELWKEIAQRYKNRWIVGGYDLLNEPVRPVRFEGDKSLEHCVPRLVEFYEECIARIRATGDNHIVTLEGHHWATETAIFSHSYDPQMVVHFHRYWCPPDMTAFEPWLVLSEKLNAPLWLGETGENTIEWFNKMIPLALSLDIGVNMWPWKKMNCINSPCSVTPPEDWQTLLDGARGVEHPRREKAQALLEAYLENMRAENCRLNEDVAACAFPDEYPHVFVRS